MTSPQVVGIQHVTEEGLKTFWNANRFYVLETFKFLRRLAVNVAKQKNKKQRSEDTKTELQWENEA